MKKRFLLVILTLFTLLNTVSFVSATSGEGLMTDGNWMYVGIIALLLATVGVSVYVICTYLGKK